MKIESGQIWNFQYGTEHWRKPIIVHQYPNGEKMFQHGTELWDEKLFLEKCKPFLFIEGILETELPLLKKVNWSKITFSDLMYILNGWSVNWTSIQIFDGNGELEDTIYNKEEM